MKHHEPQDDEARPRWRDPDEDDEPHDWEIEPEAEKEDRHPVLGGTAPMARVIFLCLVALVVLGGVIALINGVGAGFFR